MAGPGNPGARLVNHLPTSRTPRGAVRAFAKRRAGARQGTGLLHLARERRLWQRRPARAIISELKISLFRRYNSLEVDCQPSACQPAEKADPSAGCLAADSNNGPASPSPGVLNNNRVPTSLPPRRQEDNVAVHCRVRLTGTLPGTTPGSRARTITAAPGR